MSVEIELTAMNGITEKYFPKIFTCPLIRFFHGNVRNFTIRCHACINDIVDMTIFIAYIHFADTFKSQMICIYIHNARKYTEMYAKNMNDIYVNRV